MTFKLVRAPNRPVLIAAGMALLLLAAFGARTAAATANHYRMPVMMLEGGPLKDGILGIALLFVALRGSLFAGATAVIVATFMTFGVVFSHVTPLAFRLSDQITWWTAVYPAIAASLVAPSLFPWSRSANKPALFLMGVTFATLTLLVGSVVLLARL
jgi:hypothetical protein